MAKKKKTIQKMIELVIMYAEYERDEHKQKRPQSDETEKSFEVIAINSKTKSSR